MQERQGFRGQREGCQSDVCDQGIGIAKENAWLKH